MPDVITPEERAAIEAAVQAGKVQEIPRGQTCYGYEWDEGRNKLVSIGQLNGSWKKDGCRIGPRKTPETIERREAIRKLYVERVTVAEIAEKTGYARRRIYEDLRAMGIKLSGRAA